MRASPLRILLGLVLGVALGYVCVKSRSPVLARIPAFVAPLGKLFISAIQLCVIPLIVSSLIVGCAASTQTARIGRLAGRSLAVILAYLFTSAVFAGALAFPLFQRLHRWTQGGSATDLTSAVPVAAPVDSQTG